MNNLDDEQIKDQIEHELDVTQFLDLIDMSFRELVDMVFEQGINEELRRKLERSIR